MKKIYYSESTGQFYDLRIFRGALPADSVIVSADESKAIISAKSVAVTVSEPSEKQKRDAALQAMTHDFGDGRIMQTRPQDEANIIAAIELLESEGIASVSWVMADNTKHDVTIDDLRTALRSGRLQGLSIWNEYNP